MMSPPSEKVRGTRPPCPPPNCDHGWYVFRKTSGSISFGHLETFSSWFG